jgi:hypothetical protein
LRGLGGERRARSAFFLRDAFGVLRDGLVHASRLRPDPGLVRGWNAVVLLKSVLSGAVECQRGDGAIQAWSDHAPRAVRATPAGEVFVFGPDHVSIHSYTHSCISMYGVPTGGEGRTTRHWRIERGTESMPSPQRMCHRITGGQSDERASSDRTRAFGSASLGAQSRAVRSRVFREGVGRGFCVVLEGKRCLRLHMELRPPSQPSPPVMP